MNVAELLHSQALRRPDSPALIEVRRGRCRRMTFAELDQAAARGAGLLWKSGLRPGDAVLLMQPMSIALYVALAAAFRIGLVVVFVDPSAGTAHLERCCALWPPRGLIASAAAHLLRLWSRGVRRIPIRVVIGPPVPGAVRWSRCDQIAPREEIQECGSDTPALLTFTSGSTGQSRAAVRSHGLLLSQHRALERALALSAGEVCLTALPIVLLANLATGVCSLIPDADLRRPGSVAPASTAAQIAEHGPTSVIASPALLDNLAGYCAWRQLTLPGLRKVITGGAPAFPSLLDRLAATAPNAEVIGVYGATEAEPIAELAANSIRQDDRSAVRAGRGLLVGTPVPEIRLRIIPDRWGKPLEGCTDDELAALCQPPGLPGEVVVSGAHVLAGYLHGAGDDETKFWTGGTVWHRTGDAGYLDTEGRLWLLGRCAARISDRHGELYPLAVEAAAHELPNVRRAAMGSFAGRRVLLIESRAGHQSVDISSLFESLSWARLDEIRICRHIPVDGRHNSKVDYGRLYRLFK